MRILIYPIALAYSVGIAYAQVERPSSLKTVTKIMAEAVVAQDYTTAAELTYVPVHIEFDKKAVADQIRANFDVVNKEGIQLLSMNFHEPEESIQVDGQLHAVVPFTGVLDLGNPKVGKGKLEFYSFYYAISSNSGITWKLLDGSRLTSKNIKVIFPAYTGVPKLPEKRKPIFFPDSSSK